MSILKNTYRKTALAICFSSALFTGTSMATDLYGVETNTVQFLNALAAGKGQPLETLSPADARAVLIGAQAGAKLPPATVSEKVIKVNGEKIKLVIVKPEHSGKNLPAFMFFHGGGWVLGDYPTHERLIRDLVQRSGAAAIYVDYTPSPESHYPIAINQAYAATKWVADHGKEIGVNGKKLAVAGNSVGGNMAAVVALKAKEAGTPELKFQLLLWPVTNANLENTSYNQFSNGYFLTKNMMQWFWDSYTTDQAARNDIHVSPLRATLNQLKGLPPTLIQTAEFDVLRDEGEAYAHKLNAAGVPVISSRYNGMIHDFGLLNVLSDTPATQAALDQASSELKKYLK
ncbi:alpha/beta hydrolase [Shewanella ulleungensis]|uniref:Lipase n=1 Tax=Shewanella ulleungensis TaxID=2282699 RepID=A0ABQ2QDA5_9GAMM|nr:alpha/beta hydrolase [Shewanella ulleungensis]MCL1148858.1 alpha/beta hydrolase [Shewanella ulleungensis]GGP75167.1 lipase [Shewanella ulleungensis]